MSAKETQLSCNMAETDTSLCLMKPSPQALTCFGTVYRLRQLLLFFFFFFS